MDLFQMVAAGVIIMLAVVTGACLAALWHSSGRIATKERSRTPVRRAEPRGTRPSRPTNPLWSSARPVPGVAAGRRKVEQDLPVNVAESDRLKKDRPRIQAAIMRGDGKALYAIASEYRKLGYEHAAHELFEKAKWLASSGDPANRAAPSQNRDGPRKAKRS